MAKATETLTREPSLARALVIDGLFTAGLAADFLLGGIQRHSAPAYEFMLITGGPLAWGALLLLGVVAIGVSVMRFSHLVAPALRTGAVVHGLLGAMFLLSAVADPSASFAGFVIFEWNAFRLMNQASAFRAERVQRCMAHSRR